MSKPCENCQIILDSLGLTKIYWSMDRHTFASNDKIINIKQRIKHGY